jgi:hypothetical protein
MSTLHQRPPAICVDSSHRTRCDDDLNPPILKAASAFFAAELDRRDQK